MSDSVKLDRKIVLELPAAGTDATGGPADGPPQYSMNLWAAMNDESARAVLASGREDTVQVTTWTIHWRDGVDNRWLVHYGGETWRVTAAMERGRRRFLDLLCEAVR